MDERSQVAWLHRRVGWGLGPGELDELVSLGVDAVLDKLLEPDSHGLDPEPDPWIDIDLSAHQTDDGRQRVRLRRQTIGAWMQHFSSTARPLEEWMRWFWHGHLVSSLADLQFPQLMVEQLRTYQRLGMGDFGELLQAATVDPAMLRYLDGAGSKAEAPNENYGRELLELFALGVGNYTESDVKAAASALTGWRIDRRDGTAFFVPAWHDDSPQRFLGVDGVHDVDTVIEAVVAHDACARFVAGSLAEAVLGSGVDDRVVNDLASDFRSSGLDLRALLRAILEVGLDGGSQPLVMRPVPWLASCIRATQADVSSPRPVLGDAVRSMGQIPMLPPSVAGWPGDDAWLASGVTVGRLNAATVIADTTPDDAPALAYAAERDLGALADLLCHPEGFSTATLDALRDVGASGRRPGQDVLAVALASPDLVLS